MMNEQEPKQQDNFENASLTEQTTNQISNSPIDNDNQLPQTKTLNKIIPITIALILIIIFSAIGISAWQQINRASETTEISYQNNPDPSAVPSTPEPTATPTPTPTPTPSPTATPVPLFKMRIYVSNFSKARDTGEVVGAKFTIYNSNGKVAASGIQPATPPKPGGGGQAAAGVDIAIPLGTYTYKAEYETLEASGSFSINSFNDPVGYSIYLTAKPITFSGKYFVDANNSAKYEEGETFFANKKIYIYYHEDTVRPGYKAGETMTDSNGNFNVTLKERWEGTYIIGAEQVLGYRELPQPKIHNVKGGDRIEQSYYMVPKD